MKNKTILIIICVFSNFYNISAQSLADSLRAHYKFDGNVFDSSPYQNHLRSNPLFQFERFSTNDSAFILSGVRGTDQVSFFDNTTFNEMSLAFWFKSISMNANNIQSIIQGANIGTQVVVQPNTGNIGVIFSSNLSVALNSTGNYVDSVWHHIVSQNDGVLTSLYIDGVLVGTRSESLLTSSNGKFHIGRTNLQTRYFTGAINDLRIYNRILTQAEITTLSQPPLTTSLSQEDNSSNSLSIYPNPTNGRVFFTANKELLNATVYLRNIQGQIIQERVITQLGEQSFNLENEVSGVYFIETNSGGEIKIVKKIIKY